MSDIFNEDIARPHLDAILNDPEKLIERTTLYRENFLLWFLDCVNTVDEGRGKLLAAPRFAYLKDLYETMEGIGCERPHILWVEKARQIFVTWFMVAYCLWLLMYRENIRLIYGSRVESQVKDMIETRFKVMYENLTKGIPYPDLEFFSTNIKCPSRKTLLMGLASSGEGARGSTAYLVWLDEIAKQEKQSQTLAAAIEAVNAPESQLIGVTNPNPEPLADEIRHIIADSIDAKMKAEKLSRGVERLKNIQGHTILRLRFNAHPAKDEEWEKAKRLEIGQDRFEIEHGLNWRVAKGKPCFWAYEPSKSIRTVNYNPYRILHIGIDPGTNNPAAVFFQKDEYGRCVLLKAFVKQNTRLNDFCVFIEEILAEEFNSTKDLRFHIDPAGAKNNGQGTDIAVEVIEDYFNCFVDPAPVTKPDDRIILMNEFFGATSLAPDASSMIILPERFGEFYTFDGKLETGYFSDMLTMGYVRDSRGKAVKDNKYDHVADAWGYGFINIFKASDVQMVNYALKGNPLFNIEKDKKKQKKKPFLIR